MQFNRRLNRRARPSRALEYGDMRELNAQEIQQVSGGAMDVNTAITATLGLMALAPASLAVITVGTVALAFYGIAKTYQQ